MIRDRTVNYLDNCQLLNALFHILKTADFNLNSWPKTDRLIDRMNPNFLSEKYHPMFKSFSTTFDSFDRKNEKLVVGSEDSEKNLKIFYRGIDWMDEE